MAKFNGTKRADTLTGTNFKDTIHGKGGNDAISGLGGNDKLFGDDGNDQLSGDAGNDFIDGGRGIDTALFGGSYDDYVLTFSSHHSRHGHDDHHGHGHHGPGHHDHHDHGHHNNDHKLVVAGVDGTDQLRNVEWLKFDDALVDVRKNVTHFSDATLDASSYQGEETPTPNDDEIFVGDGNRPTHYNIAVANEQQVELGLKVHYRTGDDIAPSSVGPDGTAHYVVPDGRQVVDPAHNVSSANAGRAAWNLDFSVNTGIGGSAATLDNFDFKILIADNDGNAHTFTMQHLGAGNTPWLMDNAAGGFADEDGLNPQLSQNSVNLGFAFMQAAFGADFDAAGETYDIQLQAFDDGKLIASVHDVLLLA